MPKQGYELEDSISAHFNIDQKYKASFFVPIVAMYSSLLVERDL